MTPVDLEDYGSVELEYVRFDLSRSAYAPLEKQLDFVPVARGLLMSPRLRKIKNFPQPTRAQLDDIRFLFACAGEALQVIETILYERAKSDWLLMKRE